PECACADACAEITLPKLEPRIDAVEPPSGRRCLPVEMLPGTAAPARAGAGANSRPALHSLPPGPRLRPDTAPGQHLRFQLRFEEPRLEARSAITRGALSALARSIATDASRLPRGPSIRHKRNDAGKSWHNDAWQHGPAFPPARWPRSPVGWMVRGRRN